MRYGQISKQEVQINMNPEQLAGQAKKRRLDTPWVKTQLTQNAQGGVDFFIRPIQNCHVQ